MASLMTFGLTTVKFGAINGDGSMGTTLTAWGYSLRDSVKLTQDDPEITEHYSEELDDPLAAVGRNGKISLTMTLMDCDAAALANALGGTATGTPAVWTPPTTWAANEKSIEITPADGFATVKIPRASITGKINAEFSAKGIFAVDLSCTILTPTKAGEAKIKITESAA